jgi:hypothetical protein
MRRYQQRQILELIQTLKEAQALKLYANCQNCALHICEFIERIEGEARPNTNHIRIAVVLYGIRYWTICRDRSCFRSMDCWRSLSK